MISRSLRGGRPAVLAWLIGLLTVGGLLLLENRPTRADIRSLVPQFSKPAGHYSEDFWLQINVPHPEAKIYFTLDGRVPDPATATQYSQSIPLNATTPNVVIVRARAFLADGSSGPMVNGSYILGGDVALPVLSIIISPEDFWGTERGIYVNHESRGREWERPIDLTYVTAEEDGFHVGAGVRIHGGWSRYFFSKKSLRLYFRNEYGPAKLDFPLYGNDGQTQFDHLILHNSGQDLWLFKNQLVERLSQNMEGYTARSQPVQLFINGRPRGIYHIRERITERFLTENYDIPGADISDTPNNWGQQSDEQRVVDIVHWENFMAFVLANDLAKPENYLYLQTQIDLPNFVDYYLLHMFVANTDWPHHNVHQFRPRTQGGRWEWITWDNDFAFDLVSHQMVDHILLPGHPLGERMVVFLNKLLENPEFRNLFITRMADLLNTTLATPNVLTQIDELETELESGISWERVRWSIDTEWETIVTEMRTFAERRPDIMRKHMIESLDLAGTVKISFEVEEGEPGWIRVNDSDPILLPWQGVYFQDTTLQLQAIPAPGSGFGGWDGLPDGKMANDPDIQLTVTEAMSLKPRFTPLLSTTAHPGDVIITSYHVDDEGSIQGDWLEFQVQRGEGIDLRGWRLTDNDSLMVTDEGSLIFADDPLLADIPYGSTIRVVATPNEQNAAHLSDDGWIDQMLVLYVENGRIDVNHDPWFNLGPHDNVALLAPGLTADMSDDVAIDLWAENRVVIPAAFGLQVQE